MLVSLEMEYKHLIDIEGVLIAAAYRSELWARESEADTLRTAKIARRRADKNLATLNAFWAARGRGPKTAGWLMSEEEEE
jgi:hypothetical protein